MNTFTIGTRLLDDNSLPYIIAEIGVNHEGSMATAKKLIELAHEGGADAAKFQTYKADRLASRHSPSYWDTTKETTKSQFELFQKFDSFGVEDYKELARHCDRVGIDFLSTPFYEEAVDFLNPLMRVIKIASADLTAVPLLRKVAKTGKPIILSTGASTVDEIRFALSELEKAGAQSIALLHCVLNYPTAHDHANLRMIQGLTDAFPSYLVGFSDHTVPDDTMFVLTLAYAQGARIIEKHFTHDKKLQGNDHYHAMDVNDLRVARERIREAQLILGQRAKKSLDSEESARAHARRSIVLKNSVPAQGVLREDLMTVKRPGSGIGPEHWDAVVGRTLKHALEEDHILQWTDLV